MQYTVTSTGIVKPCSFFLHAGLKVILKFVIASHVYKTLSHLVVAQVECRLVQNITWTLFSRSELHSHHQV